MQTVVHKEHTLDDLKEVLERLSKADGPTVECETWVAIAALKVLKRYERLRARHNTVVEQFDRLLAETESLEERPKQCMDCKRWTAPDIRYFGERQGYCEKYGGRQPESSCNEWIQR